MYNRYGYMIIGCVNTGKKGLLVNFGWVPEDFEGNLNR